jgi:hypothetical protein
MPASVVKFPALFMAFVGLGTLWLACDSDSLVQLSYILYTVLRDTPYLTEHNLKAILVAVDKARFLRPAALWVY